LSADTTAATRSTAAREASAELLGTWAALFDLELDAVHSVRVGCNGSLVLGGRLEVDKSAVLQATLALYKSCSVLAYLLSADVEVLNLAKLGQGRP
jgi:hypothetical protein